MRSVCHLRDTLRSFSRPCGQYLRVTTPSPSVCCKGARPSLPVPFQIWDEISIPGLLCLFLFQGSSEPLACSLCCLLTLEQWLSFLPALPTSSWQREESEIGEHSDQGEPNFLWVLLVTPRKACFSSLKFQEMFYGLNRIIGLCRIGVCVCGEGFVAGGDDLTLLLEVQSAGGRQAQ